MIHHGKCWNFNFKKCFHIFIHITLQPITFTLSENEGKGSKDLKLPKKQRHASDLLPWDVKIHCKTTCWFLEGQAWVGEGWRWWRESTRVEWRSVVLMLIYSVILSWIVWYVFLLCSLHSFFSFLFLLCLNGEVKQFSLHLQLTSR